MYTKSDFIRVRNLIKAWSVVMTDTAPQTDCAVERANNITAFFKMNGQKELIDIAFQMFYAEYGELED